MDYVIPNHGVDIDVPFVSLIKYDYAPSEDGSNFLEFPRRHFEHLQQRRGRTLESQEALLSLLQSWLYFGTLAEFLGRQINYDDFVRRSSDGANILFSTNIPSLLASSWTTFERRPRAERKRVVRKWEHILACALYACETLESICCDPSSQPITLSIRILMATLASMLKLFPSFSPQNSIRALGRSLTGLRPGDKIFADDGELRNPLWIHMRDRGWW